MSSFPLSLTTFRKVGCGVLEGKRIYLSRPVAPPAPEASPWGSGCTLWAFVGVVHRRQRRAHAAGPVPWQRRGSGFRSRAPTPLGRGAAGIVGKAVLSGRGSEALTPQAPRTKCQSSPLLHGHLQMLLGRTPRQARVARHKGCGHLQVRGRLSGRAVEFPEDPLGLGQVTASALQSSCVTSYSQWPPQARVPGFPHPHRHLSSSCLFIISI